MSTTGHKQKGSSLWALALGALGVVYGDIGTSPLYALRECFSHEHGFALSESNIFGVLSLIFWTLFIIICVKYMMVVMRADNKGEGGILSLMALSLQTSGEKKILGIPLKSIYIVMGLIGAALLYGDGVITPAISVLSAVEGLKIVTPIFEPYIIPSTIMVIIGVFLFQSFGTGRIGIIFGPIIFIWFAVIAALGFYWIQLNPNILHALNPYWAFNFLFENGIKGFMVLSSVVLVVTGGEALYADMGHFGKSPIRLAWFSLVLPALTLNYFGQGALILEHPDKITNPFYMMAPDWLLAPLVGLATLAAVIASQALISGVFSLTRQAVQMGYCPRLRIIHTSSREIGQIYIPFVNWVMMFGVIFLVLEFESSSRLAGAYGIAVTATMLITTFLAMGVAIQQWKWNLVPAVIFFGLIIIIDLAVFVTHGTKSLHGGWVPVLMAAVIYMLMTTWQTGRKILAHRLKQRSVPIDDFIRSLKSSPPHRVPGAAIYMASDTSGAPIPLTHNLKHYKTLHELMALLTIKTKDVPYVPKEERVLIEGLCDGLYRITAFYGFMETPKIKHILEACRENGIDLQVQKTTFVLGRETILPTGIQSEDISLPLWREKIFAFMNRNAERPTAYFKIPPNQVIEVGIQIEI